MDACVTRDLTHHLPWPGVPRYFPSSDCSSEELPGATVQWDTFQAVLWGAVSGKRALGGRQCWVVLLCTEETVAAKRPGASSPLVAWAKLMGVRERVYWARRIPSLGVGQVS